MKWIIIIVVLIILFCFRLIRRGNLDFWKVVAKHPDDAYDFFRQRDCCKVFLDKPVGGYKSALPSGDWDGPFRLAVPKLEGKIVTIFCRRSDYQKAQQEFLQHIQDPIRKYKERIRPLYLCHNCIWIGSFEQTDTCPKCGGSTFTTPAYDTYGSLFYKSGRNLHVRNFANSQIEVEYPVEGVIEAADVADLVFFVLQVFPQVAEEPSLRELLKKEK